MSHVVLSSVAMFDLWGNYMELTYSGHPIAVSASNDVHGRLDSCSVHSAERMFKTHIGN